jgi:hypothetical protein
MKCPPVTLDSLLRFLVESSHTGNDSNGVLMKKIFLVLVLFAIGFNSVFAQQNSSITLVNNTGVGVRMIIIRQSGSNSMFNMYSYGYNPLANGRAVTLNLKTPLNGVNRYDIELEDVNGRKHIRNVLVSANDRIEIGPLPPQANPSITIVNNTGNTINAFYLRRNGSGYWEKYTFTNNQTIRNRRSFTFQLPFSTDVVNRYDIRLERPNRLGTYTKNTVRVSARNRIEFTASDADGGSLPHR